MKLDEYLSENGLSCAAFAERIDVDVTTVIRIKNSQVLPHLKTLRAIWNATDGVVTPNDLTGLHAPSSQSTKQSEEVCDG